MQNFSIPPVGFGPGSQADQSEGQDLAYMPLPSGMNTYSMHLPEPEDARSCPAALALLERIAAACESGKRTTVTFEDLSDADRALIADTLGEGEVSARLDGPRTLLAQESVFAGVWRCRTGVETVDVAPFPSVVEARAFEAVTPAKGTEALSGEGVVNAPAIAAELFDKAAAYKPGHPAHVVNLSLLPHTPEDLEAFTTAFGRGSATILSRGYGNCRIEATAVPRLWRVQYFNSMDALILDSFEVTAVPEVALAAAEDLADSAARIREVLEALK